MLRTLLQASSTPDPPNLPFGDWEMSVRWASFKVARPIQFARVISSFWLHGASKLRTSRRIRGKTAPELGRRLEALLLEEVLQWVARAAAFFFPWNSLGSAGDPPRKQICTGSGERAGVSEGKEALATGDGPCRRRSGEGVEWA